MLACQKKEFDVYAMDPNLGYPGSSDITPMLRVKGYLQKRLDDKKAKLLGITGSGDAYDKTIESGIVCKMKGDVLSSKVLEKFLSECWRLIKF